MVKILAFLLGAGSGLIGTIIRVALAGLGGWLVSKGVDAGSASNIVSTLTGLVTLVLSALGSVLNNQANA